MQWFVVSREPPGKVLNVARGQTAGMQVEDKNGNNDISLGGIREDRDAIVYSAASSPVHWGEVESNQETKISKETKVQEVDIGEMKWKIPLECKYTSPLGQQWLSFGQAM